MHIPPYELEKGGEIGVKLNLRKWKPLQEKKTMRTRIANATRCDMCSRKLAKYAHQQSEDVGPANLRLCRSCWDFTKHGQKASSKRIQQLTKPSTTREKSWRGQ